MCRANDRFITASLLKGVLMWFFILGSSETFCYNLLVLSYI